MNNLNNSKLVLRICKGIYNEDPDIAIKDKNENVWEIKENQVLTKDISLPTKQSETFKWSFKLKTDCPITDKMGGIFLILQ